MHPPSIFSYITSRKFIPIFTFGILFLAGIFYLLQLSSVGIKQGRRTIVIPTPVVFKPRTAIGTQRNYSFQYPVNFHENSYDSKDNQSKGFTFVANGKQYTFADEIQTTNTLGEPALQGIDTVEETTVMYGGRNFLREVWLVHGQPVSIHAIPNEKGFYFHIFSMTLPSTDTQKYISLFDKTLSTLRFTGDLTPPLTPAPTLQAPRILHLN